MVLSVDVGDRYVGLALGNPPNTPIHRFGTIDRKLKNAESEIMEIVEREHVTRIIVGVPVSLSGEETEQTYKSLRFIELLRTKIHPDIEIESVDETLTSVEARQNLKHEGGNLELEHAEAARLMLVDYIAHQS